MEFRIRSSGGDRQWRKLRLKDEERASVPMSTEESYDVQIWFYIYQDRWIVSCQNRIPIGSWIKPDANGENRHHPFMEWLATPVNGKDGVTHKFDELGETRVSLAIGENIRSLIVAPEHAAKALPPPGESGPFRLLGT